MSGEVHQITNSKFSDVVMVGGEVHQITNSKFSEVVMVGRKHAKYIARNLYGYHK